MKSVFRISSIIALVLIIVVPVAGAKSPREGDAGARVRVDAGGVRSVDSRWDVEPYGPVAVVDTYTLAFYTFNPGGVCDDEGWVSVDITAQDGDFFHVDDFAGLGGGNWGRLVPLEGSQSLWLGVRDDAGDPELCRYAALPGYGNSWRQGFCTVDCFTVSGDVTVDYLVSYDTEPGYDYIYLQIDNCDDNWQTLTSHNGIGLETASVTAPAAMHAGAARLRFYFISDGAFSDEDGMWPTDGAAIIDGLTVRDAGGVKLATELFELESPGDQTTVSGNWTSCPKPGYGDFAAMFPASGLVQEDYCTINNSCVWAFINGSTYDYSCGGWPQQEVVPYENESGDFLFNEIWSPQIPITGSGSSFLLSFDVYLDLPLDPLVFYGFHVRSIVDGCPGQWQDYSFIDFYGDPKEWVRKNLEVGQFVETGATHLQIALAVRDNCDVWCGIYGTGECHSHSPLFDNVALYRVDTNGPRLWVRDIHQFQDNFSADGTITGKARADMAQDILSRYSPGILPGDSAVVMVDDPEFGLDHHAPGDPSSGPAVYCWVSVDPQGQPGKTGLGLVEDPRYHVIGTQAIAGRTWTQIQMDTCFTGGSGIVADKFNVDLNDNLFVPGDTVWFFYGARSAPPSSEWNYAALPVPMPGGLTDDINIAAENADECTMLPAGGYLRGGDFLYVDGMNFRGAQWAFDTSFATMRILDEVDRYDIRGPSSAVGNHPASRVTDLHQQLIPVYHLIIWNTGDLGTAFSDGSGDPDKSDDTGMLLAFMDNHVSSHPVVYLSGDDVADVWFNELTGASANQLRNTYMNFGVASGDHKSVVDQISPWGIGGPGWMFTDGSGPDTLSVFGGCPTLNDFDVLSATGMATVEMNYENTHSGDSAPAILRQRTTNPASNDVTFVLSGFSFHEIRDAFPGGIPARAEHLFGILRLQGIIDDPVGTDNPGITHNRLAQNVPNPFNPVTTIRYEVKTSGPVRIGVYNVAGQLVRTLVDGHRTAGTVHEVKWNGLNDAGAQVSSGVYFYKLVTEGYTATRKMVLLK